MSLSVAITAAPIAPTVFTVHVVLAAEPVAQPDQEYVNAGAPSVTTAAMAIVHGVVEDLGWHEVAPGAIVTVGGGGVGVELVGVGPAGVAVGGGAVGGGAGVEPMGVGAPVVGDVFGVAAGATVASAVTDGGVGTVGIAPEPPQAAARAMIPSAATASR